MNIEEVKYIPFYRMTEAQRKLIQGVDHESDDRYAQQAGEIEKHIKDRIIPVDIKRNDHIMVCNTAFTNPGLTEGEWLTKAICSSD